MKYRFTKHALNRMDERKLSKESVIAGIEAAGLVQSSTKATSRFIAKKLHIAYMASKKPKISYDSEAEILSIRLSDKKSVDSDIYGHVVVDYGSDGQMVNVDIMNISLSEFKREPAMRKMVPSLA